MQKDEGNAIVYANRFYEKDTDSGVIMTYYYLGDRLVAVREGTTLEFVHQDHLGSTRATTSSTGSTVATKAYLPFGVTYRSTGSLSTDRKFTGPRNDAKVLYYMGARYYDPTIGRFLSPDSLLEHDNYGYVRNNPTKYIDPTGEIPWCPAGAAAAVAVDTDQLVAET